MEQKDKELLLKDLCARLPYGVIVQSVGENKILGLVDLSNPDLFLPKPYLRSLSSMTDEEFLALYDMCSNKVFQFRGHLTYYSDFKTKKYIPNFIYDSNQLDYLISHHFDYRGLIPMGLALEAPNEMYKTE